MKRKSNHPSAAARWLVFALAGHHIPAHGQVTTLQTGPGQPLQTASLPLTIPSLSRQPSLRFNFGVSTDEAISSGSFSDSFSFTLQRWRELGAFESRRGVD